MTTFPMPTAESPVAPRDDRAPEIDADPGIVELLESLGAGTEAHEVTVYRGQNQQGEFLTTYDGPEFSLARVQADYGAGRYFGQVKRNKKVVRGVRFAVGPAPRAAADAPKPAPVAAPAPAPSPLADPVVALLMGQLDRQQAMILALLNKPAAPAAPVDPLAGLDRVMKLVQPRTQLTEVLEAMRAVRELAASEGGGGGGSEWAGLIQSLPALLQSFTQQAATPGASLDNHPVVRKAREIVAVAEARKAARTMAAVADVVKSADRAIPAAVATAEPAAVTDPRIPWIREAVPMLRLAMSLPDIDVTAYAQVAIDAIEAKGLTVGDFVGEPGELVRLVLAEAPDMAPHTGTLAKLEAAILECEQPGDDDVDPMGGALDDNGNPRAGDPRQYPSVSQSPAA